MSKKMRVTATLFSAIVGVAALAGPAMAQILRDVYDIDFFNPPPWAKGSSLLPHDYVKAVWARYSPDAWREIRRRYDVTQVLARSDYSVQLPIVAEEGSFRLYRIPE